MLTEPARAGVPGEVDREAAVNPLSSTLAQGAGVPGFDSQRQKQTAAGSVSASAFLYERVEHDRAADPEHPWEQSRAEENDRLWHVEYGNREDW